jgi:hypothetical protein
MNPFTQLFEHFFVRFPVKEAYGGVCLVWQCPQCRVPRDFQMIESKAGFSILGVQVDKPCEMTDLRCCDCGYEIRVHASDRRLLEEAEQLTCLLKKGLLTLDSYQSEIRALPARFVKELLALTEVWKCPTCGEENPLSFDSCWKCRAKGGSGSGEVDADAKPFQSSLEGGNPWEK